MLEVGRIVPVYESLGGTTAGGAKLGSKWLRRVIWSLFEELETAGASSVHPTLRDETAKNGAPEQRRLGQSGFVETLPIRRRKRLKLPCRLEAPRGGTF